MNNIQLVSDNSALPDFPAQFKFDFDLNNISKTGSQFFVTNVQVLDSTGTNITNVSSTRPSIAFNNVNTYTTVGGSNVVQVNATTTNLHNGDIVYMPDPSLGLPPTPVVDGIPAAAMSGYFAVQNITGTSFEIVAAGAAAAGGNTTVANMVGIPKWDEVAPGDQTRTRDQGTITADLTGNPASAYYDITVSVGVNDGKTVAGSTPTGNITYRVYNSQQNLLNDRYDNTAVTGFATRVTGGTSQPSTAS